MYYLTLASDKESRATFPLSPMGRVNGLKMVCLHQLLFLFPNLSI